MSLAMTIREMLDEMEQLGVSNEDAMDFQLVVSGGGDMVYVEKVVTDRKYVVLG